MFDSRSTVVKFVGYAVIGFFSLIIIVSFGMPDFISRLGLDTSIVAIVNGENIHRYDFVRYKDRFKKLQSQKMENLILNYYISDVLLHQKAKKMGVSVSDEDIKEFIRSVPGLRDQKTGKFDSEIFKIYLKRSHMTFNDFDKILRKDLIKEKFFHFIRMGLAIPSDEVMKENICNNSKMQIRYAYASNMDLKRRFKNRLTVSESEISAEMKKNRSEVKDPKTDRKRIGKKLERRKLEKAKKDTIDKINTIALNGGSFNKAASILGGRVSTSNIFKIGEQLKDAGGRPLTNIDNSKIFLEGCLSIKKLSTSRVIAARSGLYIFTPVLNIIEKKEPSEIEYSSITKKLGNESLRMIERNLMQKLQEKSKIIKNLKTE